jgi:DNA polymerase-3 subunit delta
MVARSIEYVYRGLKRGQVDPAYYLTGGEEVLKDDLIGAITNAAVDSANRDFNFDVRSAGDLNGESLHALVETPPMLAERRLVVVRGLEQWRRNAKVWQVLHRYLEHPSPTTVLVLTHGAAQDPDASLVSTTTHVVVDGLKPNQIRRWLGKRAHRVGLELEDEAAEHLATALGGDLAQLAVEIEKLAAAAPGDRPLTAGDVATLVGVRRGETVHDWVDAVLARDTPRAVTLVEVVLCQAGVTAVQMVMALGTALVGVRLARALMDDGTSSRELERQVFQAMRAARPPKLRKWGHEAASWSAAARRWSAEDLDAATTVAYDADRQLKSTTVTDERGTLTNMLLRFSNRIAA